MKVLMELWKRISNTKSIMAIVGAVIIILQTAGVKVNVPYVNELATTICTLLVLLGVISKEGMNTTKWNK